MSARTTFGPAMLAVVLCLLAGGAAAATSGPAGAGRRAPFVAARADAVQPASRPPAAPGVAPAEGEHAASRGEQQPAGEEVAEHPGEAAAEHPESLWASIAQLINFAVLAWAIYYFARSPFVQYLVQRSREIRADLARAAEAREQALAEMARIEARIKALPGELEALRRRGADDTAAEEARIRQAAEEERTRLLAHARQEIDRHLRVAERELVQLAADLAIRVASARIRAAIDGEDQARLLDQYLAGMGASSPPPDATRTAGRRT